MEKKSKGLNLLCHLYGMSEIWQKPDDYKKITYRDA